MIETNPPKRARIECQILVYAKAIYVTKRKAVCAIKPSHQRGRAISFSLWTMMVKIVRCIGQLRG